MRYTFQPALSASDYQEFEELLTHCWCHEESLRDKEVEFINDLNDKHERFGRRIFVTAAQLEWLRKIAERVA